MSDENVPKLRLKPKLAAEAATTPQPAAAPAPAPAPEPEAPAPAPVEEQRSFRLKPKLAAEPAATVAPATPPAPAEAAPAAGNFPPPTPSAPAADLPPVEDLAKAPASTEDLSLQEFPPPAGEPPVIGAADEPVPAPDYVDPDDPSGPVDPESRRALTARPFPPPPANFPAPTVDGVKTVPPWSRGAKPPVAPKKKSSTVLVGGVLAAVIVLGGLFFGYRKFTAPPPEPEPRPRVVVPKKQPEPAHEVVTAPADSAAATTAQDAAHSAHATEPVAKPIEEPVAVEPPPPSPEFKAWVENLKVGGVRAGTAANTRVFIGGVAYAAGETVNSQLGIIFESYNAETRRLTFVDQHTGAKVDRRN